MGELSAGEALALRMASLQLAASDAVPAPSSAADIAHWFGALQGQDLASLQWSLGLRLPGSTLTDIEAALETGDVLRTWPMRGTIHLIPSQDARWMLRVLGEKPLGRCGEAARVPRTVHPRRRQGGRPARRSTCGWWTPHAC